MDERYYTFSTFCKKNYGRRLYRVALDAGMTCPNRDGTLGKDGCIFCTGGSGDFAIRYQGQKLEEEDLKWNHQTNQTGSYIAYFQAYSNTYAPVQRLSYLYEQALIDATFAGISIATRPDCFNEDIYGLLAFLKRKHKDKFIWIELGLQSANDKTADWMRRGYKLAVYDECVERLHELGIPVITHVIAGLYNEEQNTFLKTIDHLNAVKTDGIKIHLLHVLKGSVLGTLYEQNPSFLRLLSKEEYVDWVVNAIAHLRPETVIHRLTGDGNAQTLLAPLWSLDKKSVLNAIRHELKERDIVQGCLYETTKYHF